MTVRRSPAAPAVPLCQYAEPRFDECAAATSVDDMRTCGRFPIVPSSRAHARETELRVGEDDNG